MLLHNARRRNGKKDKSTAMSGARLRGGTFTMMVLDIPAEGDPMAEVDHKMQQAPSFFESAPVVLDFQNVPDSAPFDLNVLLDGLRERGLVPVGTQNGSERQNAEALNVGLCPFPLWRSGRDRPDRDGKPGKRAAPSDTRAVDQEPQPAMLVTQPVRSGQRIYAKGTDLVAAAPISPGAELIADGHVHIYGRLRGRALAGVRGDTSARIFCQSLEAELISIAGAYKVRDDIDEKLIGAPVQISLKDERLIIEPLVKTQRV